MTTDDDLLRGLAHLQLAWNSPLSISHADRLLASLEPLGASQVVDLGCGWGGLLLRALSATPGATGIGVDRNPSYLDRARSAARDLGIGDRVRFVTDDIAHFAGVGDRVICIGADHAWGGADRALTRLRPMVEARGRLLFGCGYWIRAASPTLIEMFGDLPGSFEDLLARARSSGWMVRSSDSADLAEWDHFESTWRQDLDDLAARESGSLLGGRALRLSAQRREEYERGYRGILGFAYLVLQRSEEAPGTDRPGSRSSPVPSSDVD